MTRCSACDKHPKYKGVRLPQRECLGCWVVWMNRHQDRNTFWIAQLLALVTKTLILQQAQQRRQAQEDDRYAF